MTKPNTYYKVLVNQTNVPFDVVGDTIRLIFPPTDKRCQINFVIDSKIKRIDFVQDKNEPTIKKG